MKKKTTIILLAVVAIIAVITVAVLLITNANRTGSDPIADDTASGEMNTSDSAETPVVPGEPTIPNEIRDRDVTPDDSTSSAGNQTSAAPSPAEGNNTPAKDETSSSGVAPQQPSGGDTTPSGADAADNQSQSSGDTEQEIDIALGPNELPFDDLG